MTDNKIIIGSSVLFVVCKGEFARVILNQRAKDEYDEIQKGTHRLAVQRRTHLKRYFDEFCNSERPRFTDEKLKSEGRFKGTGGREFQILAFKVWQWRLYGCAVQHEGIKSYFGVIVDPNKKQNKADRTLLKATAEQLSALGIE